MTVVCESVSVARPTICWAGTAHPLGNQEPAQDLVDGGLFGKGEGQDGLQAQGFEDDKVQERVLPRQVVILLVSVRVNLSNKILLHLQLVGEHDARGHKYVCCDVEIGEGRFGDGLEELCP